MLVSPGFLVMVGCALLIVLVWHVVDCRIFQLMVARGCHVVDGCKLRIMDCCDLLVCVICNLLATIARHLRSLARDVGPGLRRSLGDMVLDLLGLARYLVDGVVD